MKKGQQFKKKKSNFIVFFSNLFFSLRQLITFFFLKKRKGQQFTVFKMMIAAAFAMALLVLVYQFIYSVSCPTDAVLEIKNLLIQASNTPEKCYAREQLCFDKGTILQSSFYTSSIPGISSVHLEDNNLGICSTNECNFNSQLTIPISVKCISSSSCDVFLASSSCQ